MGRPWGGGCMLTAEPRWTGAIEIGDLVDAGCPVLARTRPALVPIRLAVIPREPVLTVAVVVSSAEKRTISQLPQQFSDCF